MKRSLELDQDDVLRDNQGNMFIPCKSCELFRQLIPSQFELLKQCCLRTNVPIEIHCMSCQQNDSLLAQIDDLNNT